ncbi:MAG: type II toxin-antitoxin system VapC family toxin [Kineosporiaceae bacterium]|nr:type II toxin-antitoxin system VapC family toxin [Aeromicrobium sp.]
MLVDTHILLWIAEDDPRLGERARELIGSRHPVYYSSMSVLELVIKKMRGRLRVANDICSHLDGEGLRQLPLVGEHSESIAEFPELIGHDPFDTVLLAQAKVKRLEFLTADRRLLALDYDWILDATK